MATFRKSWAMACLILLGTGLFLTACGGHADLQKQMSGVWEDRLGHETVEIQLTGNAKTVTVGGHAYDATVDRIDDENGVIRLSIEDGGGKKEFWTLTQMWEDTDRFNIVFDMAQVDFVSSAGLRVMIAIQKTCKKWNRGELVLVNVPERIYETLDLAGFVPLFQIFDELVEAVGYF